MAHTSVAGGGGAGAPPHPSAFQGAPPPGPPKRRSTPLAATVGLFSFDRATCPVQPRCQGQNLFQESDIFLKNHLSGAAALPGADLFLKIELFLKKPLVRGNGESFGAGLLLNTLIF